MDNTSMNQRVRRGEHAHGHLSLMVPCPRRVRVYFNNVVLANSKRVMLVRDQLIPAYYFPQRDVRMDLLQKSDREGKRDVKGQPRYWHVQVDGRSAADAAMSFRKPEPGFPDLGEYITFQWKTMDAWFEEDDEVLVHARDPYHRVDVLRSSRYIEVVIDGTKVADTRRPSLLFETGLPTRYYIPKQDTHRDLLHKTDTVTQCPYKGVAEYFSVRIGEKEYKDYVWSYPFPTPECPKIEGLLCFYNEFVDLFDDGELLERPVTVFSRGKA